MLSLHEKGYGVDKGIPTLIIAAASVDDVLAISGFGVVLGIAFSKGVCGCVCVAGWHTTSGQCLVAPTCNILM